MRRTSVAGRLCGAMWVAAMSTGTLNAQPSPPPPAPSFKTYPVPPQAPAGAPNVLVIMTDDVGFSASTTFGGAIPTTTFEQLASRGLRYDNFYTTSLCSPSRAALLTGRNHHRVGFGALADVATDEPGYNGIIPDSAGTFGRVLKGAGYDTSWFGKNHNTPLWENTPLGSFDRWPIGLGFDYFYGFNGAETDQFSPAVIENINNIRPFVGNPHYIFDRDMADHAVQWLQQQRSLRPDRPFLMYYAPGSAHDPAQAPRDWIERFKGKFDGGWDQLREETFKRQKAMGIIPANARLTPRPPAIPAWASLTPQQKRVAARMMEVYAAQLAFCDNQIGRVIDELKRLGQFDNTLIIYIQGDNGASELSGPAGTTNQFASMNGNPPTWNDMDKSLEDFGGPHSSGTIQAGWAYAMNTPFQWSKSVASHLGGLRDGVVVSWPERIKAHGEVRRQFTHLIDIVPTIYDAVGIKPPEVLDGHPQMPLDGFSFAHTFTSPTAPSRHREQYFELLGNRGFYRDGWLANTVPANGAWVSPTAVPVDNVKWELYNLNDDYSQAVDLSSKYPSKLAELQAAFDRAAKDNNVYPIRYDYYSRLSASLRPSAIGRRDSVNFYPSDSRIMPQMFPDMSGRSWKAVADIEVTPNSGDGTLIAQGGWAMGWGLFVLNGKASLIYRTSDHDPEVRIQSPAALSPGKHLLEARFTVDRAPAMGGVIALLVDGREISFAPIKRKWTFIGLPGSVGQLGDDVIGKEQALPFKYGGTINQVAVSAGF